MQSTDSDGWTLVLRAHAQMHRYSNNGELREKTEDASIGFPKAEPIEPGGPDQPYFSLGDDTLFFPQNFFQYFPFIHSLLCTFIAVTNPVFLLYKL